MHCNSMTFRTSRGWLLSVSFALSFRLQHSAVCTVRAFQVSGFNSKNVGAKTAQQGLSVHRMRPCSGDRCNRHFATRQDGYKDTELKLEQETKRRIVIVGGGLAGLSLTYHLLKLQANMKTKSKRKICITVMDQMPFPGMGGASAVAGGLLHPLSPKGKMVFLGEEALEAANELLTAASKHHDKVFLRDRLYRLATSAVHVKQLSTAAEDFPHIASWKSKEEIKKIMSYSGYDFGSFLDSEEENDMTAASGLIAGGLELSNGCSVIHVPTYLKGLWQECLQLAGASDEGDGSLEWTEVHHRDEDSWEQCLKDFDTVVYAAGSGLFRNSAADGVPVLGETHGSARLKNSDHKSLPVELVRGQSIELNRPSPLEVGTKKTIIVDAFLCGKYATPTLEENRVLIGATHEYKETPLDQNGVLREIQSRTPFLPPNLWEEDNIHRITKGWRVQSNRGAHGRLPIIGKLSNSSTYLTSHDDAWIFSGLSSRGILYHGIYGKWLSDMILMETEDDIVRHHPHIAWWR
jgi:glycine/D-amino acid oxidase-like deaminating enzyme